MVEETNDLRLVMPEVRPVVAVLTGIAVTLVVLSAAVQLASRAADGSELFGLVRITYVDGEANLPTWYSSGLLLVAAAIHAVVALVAQRREDRWARHWWALAILFVALSLDEAAMIHELPIDRLREAFDASGILYEAWVVPGALVAGVVALSFARFLKALRPPIAAGYLLAGALFVAGAIGVEMVTAVIADGRGRDTLMYVAAVSVEELLEMIGVTVLIGVVATELQSRVGSAVVLEKTGAPVG
jgi:hypothetical protein